MIEAEMKEVVADILEDYGKNRIIDRVNNVFDQPDKDQIIEIIHKLLRIIFPGYFRDHSYRYYNTSSNLAVQIEDVMYHLNKQCAIVLRSAEDYMGKSEEEIKEGAQELSIRFLKTIPKIREYLATDLQAVFDGDPAAKSFEEIVLAYPGLLATAVHRVAHELFLLRIPLIPRIMSEYAHSVTGIDIHPGATIGKYFCMDHGTGIVVGETTLIGEHVKVYQGVTLGALSTRGGQKLRGKRRHPTIEDNVTIYAGASILGGDTVIGKDAVIGSNVFITTSIPSGARVSIKTQELQVKYGPNKKVESSELQDDSW